MDQTQPTPGLREYAEREAARLQLYLAILQCPLPNSACADERKLRMHAAEKLLAMVGD